MTTIVGLQGDNFAVVYVDSRISSSDSGGYISQISTLKEGCGKVAVNGKYLLGAAGDVRAINILHHVFQPPTPPINMRGKKLDQFFTAKFIPALRECFEQQGYAIPDIKEDKEHMAEQASTILVVIHGIIYVVDGDYSWTSDSSGMYALGSGSSYALGALQALVTNRKLTIPQAKKLALKALSTAAKFDPYTGSPFHCHIQEQGK
jgi:ATP-dependent protease HslVU (ClpYQ) peptidase subunit